MNLFYSSPIDGNGVFLTCEMSLEHDALRNAIEDKCGFSVIN